MTRSILSTLILLVAFCGAFAQTVKVTNTSDSGPGSLRQAIIDANNSAAIDNIEFEIPLSDANYNASTGVFTIKVTSAVLPDITNPQLHIDGSTQAAKYGNTNTATLGYSGPVGYINTANLSKVEGPEIEIVDDGGFNTGLFIKSDNVTISDLAVHSFGNTMNNQNANVYFRFADHGKIENCVIGSPAHAIIDPGTNENKGSGLLAVESDYGHIDNCLFTQGKGMGGYLKQASDNWTIENSQFFQNGKGVLWTDGLDVALNTQNCIIRNNIFHENGGNGFDTFMAIGKHTITGNSMIKNGQLEIEASGIRVYGTDNEFKHNLIHTNMGAGIMVSSGASKIKISQNRIFNNGRTPLPSNAFGDNLDQIGIDLLSSTDNHSRGTKPYVTVNDNGDGDLGANNLQNFSVIESATIAGGQLTVKGFAPSGADVEFFIADTYPGNLVPQGKTYLFTATEGSASDLDANTGSYGPGMVNGQNQGQETGVNRFEFTVAAPAGLSANDTLTSTATLGGHTSEFGGYTAVAASSDLSPTLECVYINKNGDYVGRFGYSNTFAGSQNEPIGAQNGFTPAPVNRGQPTTFAVGTQSNVVEATFSSGTLTWNLRGTTVTADASTSRCPADLEVTTVASNNTPATGDTITITVTVKNLTAGTPATNVDILNTLDPDFVLISSSTSKGTYTSGSGIWNLDEVINGAPQTLTLTLKINGDGDFNSGVQSQNQMDPVSSNNSSSETLTTSGSSGGNNGGIESDGRMATLIAKRNFNRIKTGAHRFYDFIEAQPSLSTFQNSYRGKVNGLADYIPASGPQNTSAVVTTPHDLLGITNAVNVFAADYYKAGNIRLGAVLALETRNAVYNHTKVICDRLGGAVLDRMDHVLIDNKPFAMAKLMQQNGQVDYAITFVAYKDAQGNFQIDNKWNQYEYDIPNNVKVYNFQVWTVSESVTRNLVASIIKELKNDGQVQYINNGKAILPTVYVKTGWYEDGKLVLDVKNNAGAREIIVNGLATSAENANPQAVSQVVALDPTLTDQIVMVDFGYIFDAGFTLVNDNGGGTDQLYFADGPWGTDFTANTGVRNYAFNVFQESGFTYQPNAWHLEREVVFTGEVKEYLSVYRLLRPGNETANISDYNQVSFEASLKGIQQMEVTLIDHNVEKWGEQYRTTLTVSGGNLQNYRIDFADFQSTSGRPLDLSAIDGINFAVIGNYQNFVPVSLHINNVELNDQGNAVSLTELETGSTGLDVYPNPFAERTQIELELPQRSEVRLTVTDLSGAVIDRQSMGTHGEGRQQLTYQAPANLAGGVYLLQVDAAQFSATKKIIVSP